METGRRKTALALLDRNGGYATTAEFFKNGIDNRLIAELVVDGLIVKVKRGVYQLPDIDYEYEQFLVACSSVPSGVVCLLSALEYHGLTTFMAKEVSLAIPRKTWAAKLPDYPPMKLVYFSEVAYRLGVTTVNHNGGEFKVFDAEKTVCDVFRYRRKLGQDIALEAVKEYMRRKPRNIQKLMEYARQLRVENNLRPLLEALV